jgi:uncharacterized protein
VLFFLIAFLITGDLVYVYSQSFKLTVIADLLADGGDLAARPADAARFGIDPMSILVPFLIFAIGVSHGVQMVSAWAAEVYEGADSETAAKRPSAGCWSRAASRCSPTPSASSPSCSSRSR